MPGSTVNYWESLRPPPWRIFGRRLLPYAIGHEISLQVACSSVLAGNPTVHDIDYATWICSLPGDAFLFGEPRRSFAVYVLRRAVLRLICWRKPGLIIERYRMLRDYIAESCRPPKMWAQVDADAPRMPGTPLVLRIIHRLISLGYSQQDVLRMPFARALWEVAALSEAAGRTEIVNPIEEGACSSTS